MKRIITELLKSAVGIGLIIIGMDLATDDSKLLGYHPNQSRKIKNPSINLDDFKDE